MPTTKFTLKVPEIGNEKTITLNIEEKKFVVFPRIFIDSPERMNYNLDWNRQGDEKLQIRSSKQIKCVEGTEIYDDFYNMYKKQINNDNYYPPYLRIFPNHKQIILLLFV